MSQVLAIDAGTSRLRAVVFDAEGRAVAVRGRELGASHPAPGRVEFDARALADAVLALCRELLAETGPVAAVGIANQRASCVVWERASGEPVAPAQGWQDLRVQPLCARWRERGVVLAPNQSAAKLLDVLDRVDPERRRDLCFGTVDAWLGSVLSGGALHATDASNASATGLLGADLGWDRERLAALAIPESLLPRLVDSAAALAPASALPGAPPLAARVGDQQGSLLGQGCVTRGAAKLTVGTSAMLDVALGPEPAGFPGLGPRGTFPIVAWQVAGEAQHALEASELCAGGCVEWLRELGVIREAAELDGLAVQAPDSAGVVFVPALQGLGTPLWDHRARGAFLGLTRGSGRPQLVRALLDGLAIRCAELLEAAEADAGLAIASLRVDGGLTRSASFVQALADACQRPLAVSAGESTARGAALLAGHAVGVWPDLEAVARALPAGERREPRRSLDRARWREALARVR